MDKIEISKDVITSFWGMLLALFSAGIVWFLKSAYEKHKAEVLALAKLERSLSYNRIVLNDNFEFINSWEEALKSDNPFSFQFAEFLINDDETYKISNLELINRVLTVHYMLRRTSLDNNNLYESYWKIIYKIDEIADPKKKEDSLNVYHNGIISALQRIKPNQPVLDEKLIETIAFIRAVHEVRRHSLFGYLSHLFNDIWPRVTDASVQRHVLYIKESDNRLKGNA